MADNYENYEPTPNEPSPNPENKQEELPGLKRNFWQRNGATIITLAILGLIIGGAIAVNERRTGDLDLNETTTENGEVNTSEPTENGNGSVATGDTKITGEIGSGAATIGQIADLGVVKAIRETEKGEERIKISTGHGLSGAIKGYEVSADRGEGRTHLARRAITTDLQRRNLNLTPEQRVYAEDYLQKTFSPKVALDPGSTISFTSEQISQTITAAEGLTPAQLDNLEKWSVLVSYPAI